MMKSPKFILLVGMFVIIESEQLDTKLSFEGCDHDGWKVKNISIAPTGDKINFTANIISSPEEVQKTLNISHLVKLTLTGCNNDSICTNLTNWSIGNSNCTANNSESDNEKCRVIKIIEDWARESINLNILRENRDLRDGCILYETPISKSLQTIEKSEHKINGNASGFILDPFLKHVAANPTIIF